MKTGIAGKISSSRLFCIVTCCVMLTLQLTGRDGSNAGEELYRPPVADLPEVLLTFDGGRVTREDFTAAVLEAARASMATGLPLFRQSPPPSFLQYLMLDQLQKNPLPQAETPAEYTPQKVVPPLSSSQQPVTGMYAACAAQALTKWQEAAAQAGGSEVLIHRLAAENPPRTAGDLFRRLRLEELIRQTGIGTIPAWKIDQRFHPQWHGLQGRRVASVGGLDFTDQDLAQYLLREAGDYELQLVLERLAAERIVLAEAEKMGLNTGGRTPEEIGREVFAPLLTRQAILDFARANPDFTTVRRCRIYFLRATGQEKDSMEKQAQELLRRVQAGDAPGWGERVFFAPPELPAGQLNPEWFGLDYFYPSAGEKLSPLQTVSAAWKEALKNLPAEGATLLPVAEGWVVLKCEECFFPRQLELLIPALSGYRQESERARLVRAVLAAPGAHRYWQPSARTSALFPSP